MLSRGIVFVVLGLTLFIYVLELALFPISEELAHGLAERGSLKVLIAFAFLLGFGTTTAAPALIAAFGVGLASSLSGRNPMTGGFGLIARGQAGGVLPPECKIDIGVEVVAVIGPQVSTTQQVYGVWQGALSQLKTSAMLIGKSWELIR